MQLEFDELLSPRIKKHCLPAYQDGHFKHAAHEAMIQVELALKEKGQVTSNLHGHSLITSLFNLGGKNKTIKLKVPLGKDRQGKAEELFKGVFSYYRNYTAHDGSKISGVICVRIMIIASELLDLIDASALTFLDLGGPDGLINAGVFQDKRQILELLQILDGNHLPDGETDGLVEMLLENYGMDEIHINSLLELDLVRYEEVDYIPSAEELRVMWDRFDPPQTMGFFTVTDLGKQFIKAIEKEDIQDNA